MATTICCNSSSARRFGHRTKQYLRFRSSSTHGQGCCCRPPEKDAAGNDRQGQGLRRRSSLKRFLRARQRLILLTPALSAGRFQSGSLAARSDASQAVLPKHHANVTTQIANAFVRGWRHETNGCACNVERVLERAAVSAYRLSTNVAAFIRAAGAK